MKQSTLGKVPYTPEEAGYENLTGYNDGSRVCFGVEVEENYPLELLSDFEVYHFPQCKYIVFNCFP
jgi:hypothetical protein